MFDEEPDDDIHGQCAHEIHRLGDELTRLRAENAELAALVEAKDKALAKISRWKGEFPDIGKFWGDGSGRPVSYGANFGSNGERDYMRNIAGTALALTPPDALKAHDAEIIERCGDEVESLYGKRDADGDLTYADGWNCALDIAEQKVRALKGKVE